ncbi:ecto-ADP-ribosyltransferase 4-like [Halichoeres trimaculatus]|uniref:ecto-ADP-ribosyltransferase 4-like n=1 Tax=Halichoeres trimaculatus TaxID=147232 RepID=UPI003D9EDDE8
MPTLVPLFFLFVWMLPADSIGLSFRIPQRQANPNIPLSMAEESVDDMYFGCHREMMILRSKYFQKEIKNAVFANAWYNAARCAKKKPRVEDKALTTAHMHAICVYTSDDIYTTFNNAVRTQGPVYNTRFKFHSLHFLLTSAIQILKSNNHCYITYRRTKNVMTGHENQVVRFGTFASSSFKTNLIDFGNQTCFKIKTCFGAYLKNYPAYDNDEEEVLIPPYEKFRITNKMIGSVVRDLQDCKIVYVLESAGVLSTQNCKAVNPLARQAESER